MVAALRRNIKGRIGAPPLAAGACLALSSRNFFKRCEQNFDDADSTRTDVVNCGIHFYDL